MFNSRSRIKYALASFLSVSAFMVASNAKADPKACITAHASGQREAKAGHLRLATQLFTKCGSDDSCPAQLRQECAEFLQSVQQTVPTVIFSVLDEKNHDISSVKVFSTDELVADGLDGRAIQIDPGKHRLRFLLPWGDVLSSDVLIREGEKNRLIQVKIGGDDAKDISPKEPNPPPQTNAAQSAPSPTPMPTPAARRTPPLGAWIAAGTAVASLGVGTTFAILGSSKKADIDACAPNCTGDSRSTYDTLKRDYLIADIGFAVGLVSAGVATWLFVAPSSHTPRAGTDSTAKHAVWVRPVAVALPGGGAIAVSGGF